MLSDIDILLWTVRPCSKEWLIKFSQLDLKSVSDIQSQSQSVEALIKNNKNMKNALWWSFPPLTINKIKLLIWNVTSRSSESIKVTTEELLFE